ncbi:ParB/Srx family N-terminal domain-containing protein [Phyllobacterium myrsinacearum]|uniref:ParB-like N-terminal domain-containing protein n=1 Tax=Phyllobacterium myrsinacearum TaxID=28101 RepID=A0A839EU51_9HYPH|nr:ParB/Srx family N-terminal domain-containing protein [Phyllobacterium myrsinacearum]MBA8881708.1 hypothetical protein [Phyllobacterium myrsinacearum]
MTTKTPAETVELWDIDRIKEYKLNAKIHNEKQVTDLAKSIKAFGFSQPIIVWTDGTIIAGHGRRLAAISLGMKKVPVVCRSDLSKAEADAMRLSDNKVTSVEYDMSMLQDELQRLVGEDIDIDLTGYSDFEIQFSTDDIGEMDEGAFVGDIGAAVEVQAEENKRAAGVVDDVAAPITDALGFKRVTIAQSRTIRELVARVEAKTGKTGVDALIAVLSAAA